MKQKGMTKEEDKIVRKMERKDKDEKDKRRRKIKNEIVKVRK
jgi:hypothetical protein